MTTANKIISFPKESIVWTDARLEESIANIIQTIEETKAKSGKTPLTLQSPTLSSLGLTETKKEKKENYLEALMAFMSSVLVYGIKMNTTEMDSLAIQRTIADVQMKVIQQAEKLVQEKLSEASSSPFSTFLKIFSYIGASLMVVAGFITANPMLLIGGAAMIASTAFGAGEALSKALEDVPVAGRIGIILGIAVGAALAVSLLASALAPAAAAEGAAAGAATGASFGAKVAARTLLIGAMLNLFGEVSRGIAEGVKASKEDQEIAALVGSIAGIVISMYVSYKVENFSEPSLKLSANLSNAMTAVHGVEIVNALLVGLFSILEGDFQMKAAKRRLEVSGGLAAMEFYTHMLDQNNATVKGDQEAINASAKGFARMNATWDSYVAPYRTGVENMA